MSRASRRDRRVYVESHPLLFALLALLRRRPVVRLGRRVLVNDAVAFRTVLTDLPLDRTSALTTGGAICRRVGAGALFDESGESHRTSRRALADRLDVGGVGALRSVWEPVLAAVSDRLGRGLEVDVSVLADDVSGRTTAALLGRPDLDPSALARAARRTAYAAAAEELPSLRRRVLPEEDLAELVGADPLDLMLALAAVTTTYASLPRAVAWAADAGLWPAAGDPSLRGPLADELLRVISPTPVLPRVPAQDGIIGGCPVRAGEQLLLVTRHATTAQLRGPDPDRPAPAALSRLVFGAGRHSCPGARLARAQLDDLLAAFAPHAPVVVRARVDRRAALPAWRSLVVRAP